MKAVPGAECSVGLAHHGVGVVGPFLGKFASSAAFVDEGKALIGGLGGDDALAGDALAFGFGLAWGTARQMSRVSWLKAHSTRV